MAVLEKVALMGGEFELVRLSQRPKTWYFRFYVRGSGQQKNGYVVRSLKTDDSSRKNHGLTSIMLITILWRLMFYSKYCVKSIASFLFFFVMLLSSMRCA